MKTLKQITLTTLMMTLMINVAVASSYTTFRMQISDKLNVEVLSEKEELVQEEHPVVNKVINKFEKAHTFFVLDVKEEQPVEEDLITVKISRPSAFDRNLNGVLSKLIAEEEEIDDLDFDTRKVFEQYAERATYRLTPEILDYFVMEEADIEEDELAIILNEVAK